MVRLCGRGRVLAMLTRVAYQGEPGAFSETAARDLVGDAISPVPAPSFEAMFSAVIDGEADLCVAPIENTLAGSIHRNYDLLLESPLTIIGETNLRVVHCLIAPQDVAVEDVRRVYSHPVALAQCSAFLASHASMEPVAAHDTAGSVRVVIERGRRDEAAIASAAAAAIYGARVLLTGIEDNAQNFTRFLLLAREDRSDSFVPKERKRWKTSIVFRVANQPGALYHSLGAFANAAIDLAKIESRPVAGRPWEYSFYLDVIGRRGEPAMTQALADLTAMSEMVRVLGSYPAAD